MEFSIVSIKIIRDSNRLDAEFFRPIFLETENQLRKIRCVMLGDICTSIRKGIFYILASEYKKSGVPFIRVTDLDNPFIDLTNATYISSTKNVENNRTILVPNDIAISKSGTLGNIGLVTDDLEEVNISQDVIGVKGIDRNLVLPRFVAIYLLTAFGQNQLQRGKSLQVQPHLTLEVVRNLQVPKLRFEFQNEISEQVGKAHSKKKKAVEKYRKAENILYSLLNSKSHDLRRLREVKFFVINSHEVSRTLRFDAEYYHPVYAAIEEILEANGKRNVGNSLRLSDERFESRDVNNLSKEFIYVPISKIKENGQIINDGLLYGYEAPGRAKMKIRKGDVLVPRLSGTFKKIALVPDELDGQVTTNGCFVVRSDLFLPEFLFLLFRTELLQFQMERITTGGIMPSMSAQAFSEVFLPSISREAQTDIVLLIQSYFKELTESDDIIRSAISRVEDEVTNAASS